MGHLKAQRQSQGGVNCFNSKNRSIRVGLASLSEAEAIISHHHLWRAYHAPGSTVSASCVLTH